MAPYRVWEKFIEVFPGMKSQVAKFYGHGDNTIKIYLKNHNSLIFSVNPNDGTWDLKRGKA